MNSKHTSMLRIVEVCQRTGLSKSQIHRMVDEGVFPPSIKLSCRATAWVASEVESWLQARIAESRSGL